MQAAPLLRSDTTATARVAIAKPFRFEVAGRVHRFATEQEQEDWETAYHLGRANDPEPINVRSPEHDAWQWGQEDQRHDNEADARFGGPL